MKRMKKHKPKPEMPETSTFRLKDSEEHDLAYYIHDRVELMHQVFSVIKTKELKAMIPQCVKNISLDDLQELCTEELLGISSKRLCAILDGAEPPSDTESSSSSPEQMETISLDSISSDDEVLSQSSSRNKKHKHKKRKAKNSKNKEKRRESEKNDESSGDEEKNRASRAGLTVLELLELQARARAIRAQLQKDQINNKAPESTENAEMDKSDDEVEIKEEPADVVEISSEDEKPNVEQLNAKLAHKSSDPEQTTKEQENPATVTKRINDLVITVPQTKQTRKIKLNRNKVVICETTKPTATTNNVENNKEENTVNAQVLKQTNVAAKEKEPKKSKAKKKDKNRKKVNKKDGSDHDEITLQLSDTEKMDLLEDLDRKNYDNVSSSSKDSENSSESSDDTSNNSSDSEDPVNRGTVKKNNEMETTHNTNEITVKTREEENMSKTKENSNTDNIVKEVDVVSTNLKDNLNIEVESIIETNEESNTNDAVTLADVLSSDLKENENSDFKEMVADESQVSDNQKNDCKEAEKEMVADESQVSDDQKNDCKEAEKDELVSKDDNKNKYDATEKSLEYHGSKSETENIDKNLSDGEISEKSDPAVTTEIVCLSDEEIPKKKKDKKVKKKSKKSNEKDKEIKSNEKDDNNLEIFTLNDEDEDEIFELSDDSSCYEVAGVSVLSKEPTTIEIEALSAKVDDTIREEIGIEVEDNESLQSEKEGAENISWKDRYLDSKKVKRVLKTSKILNALRKKNKELKKKLEESKKVPEPVAVASEEEKKNVEGTIDEYNNLEGSTKYVDPVSEKSQEEEVKEVSKEMEKDAKQLLKMYKKLLKYNDMNKQKTKDPNRKKSKKSKKKKEKPKEKGVGASTTTSVT